MWISATSLYLRHLLFKCHFTSITFSIIWISKMRKPPAVATRSHLNTLWLPSVFTKRHIWDENEVELNVHWHDIDRNCWRGLWDYWAYWLDNTGGQIVRSNDGLLGECLPEVTVHSLGVAHPWNMIGCLMMCQVRGKRDLALIAFTQAPQVSKRSERFSFLHQNITEQEKNGGVVTGISLSEEEQPRCRCDGFESSLEIYFHVKDAYMSPLQNSQSDLKVWVFLHFWPQDNILPARLQSCDPNQQMVLQIS